MSPATPSIPHQASPDAAAPARAESRIVCMSANDADALFANAERALATETFSVLAFLWPRRLQRALDAAWRTGDGATLQGLAPDLERFCAPARGLLTALLARRAAKQPSPRFVCLDLESSLAPAARNAQRLRRLQSAMLSGERALMLIGEGEDAESFLAALRAQLGDDAVELRRAA